MGPFPNRRRHARAQGRRAAAPRRPRQQARLRRGRRLRPALAARRGVAGALRHRRAGARGVPRAAGGTTRAALGGPGVHRPCGSQARAEGVPRARRRGARRHGRPRAHASRSGVLRDLGRRRAARDASAALVAARPERVLVIHGNHLPRPTTHSDRRIRFCNHDFCFIYLYKNSFSQDSLSREGGGGDKRLRR